MTQGSVVPTVSLEDEMQTAFPTACPPGAGRGLQPPCPQPCQRLLLLLSLGCVSVVLGGCGGCGRRGSDQGAWQACRGRWSWQRFSAPPSPVGGRPPCHSLLQPRRVVDGWRWCAFCGSLQPCQLLESTGSLL